MLKIKINGIVQGVGFRPFVFILAKKLHLKGFTLNSNDGLEIEVQGRRDNLQKFIDLLKKTAPPAAKIESFQVKTLPNKGYTDFEIRKSSRNRGLTFIAPDLAVCQDCVREFYDPGDYRYQYPFINCTNCGPRYSIIEKTPYDRPVTTMNEFEMCEYCRKEYENPYSRRFHAQPIACQNCGPKLTFLDKSLQELPGRPIDLCREALKSGKIVGIKGIGGFHIACDATNEMAVGELRKRKNRPHKPFAVMCRVKDVRAIVKCSDSQMKLLKSVKAPIVIIPKNKQSAISGMTAPFNPNLGVFAPYTPLHYQLFNESLLYLIMTSGNINDEPIAVNESELTGLCDCFLTHNRQILNRCDDSVIRPVNNFYINLRRARGYVPSPFSLPVSTVPTLGTGAEMKISFVLTRDRAAYLSPYIGNNNSKATEDFYVETLDRYKKWFKIQPELAACDMHPDYLTTHYANKLTTTVIKVQHHHAHIASVMAEHQLNEPVIGIAYDGTGYGEDGAMWGGEIFTADYSGYSRRYHLNYMPLPGGDAAITYPVRIAYAYLHSSGEETVFLRDISSLEKKTITRQIDNKFNLFQTSSMGRLFDCVAAMLGLFPRITFEAQSAMALEFLCADAPTEKVASYPYELKGCDINIVPLIRAVSKDILNGISKNVIAEKFHNSIIDFTVEAVREISKDTGLKKIVLSGGVMQNVILLKGLIDLLTKEGLSVFYPKELPANDGAVSVGQALIANSQVNIKETRHSLKTRSTGR